MTLEKAIEIITNAVQTGDYTAERDRALAIVQKDVEKQVPQKPIDEFLTHAIYDSDGNYLEQVDITTFKCPYCNHILASGEISTTSCAEIHYCENCGKAMDWSVEE